MAKKTWELKEENWREMNVSGGLYERIHEGRKEKVHKSLEAGLFKCCNMISFSY